MDLKLELVESILKNEEKNLKRKVATLEKKIILLEKKVTRLVNLPACPKCKSKIITKHGTRKTLNGSVQTFFCKKCNRKFSKKGITYRMRNNEKDIRKALWLRKKGYTLAQIAEIIGGISRQSILRWLKKDNIQLNHTGGKNENKRKSKRKQSNKDN